MGFFSSIGKFFKKAIRIIGRIGGNDPYGNWAAWGGVPSEKTAQIKAAEEASRAEQEARRRAHEEEVQSLAAGAAETLQRRKRRGAYATILTGGPTLSYGSPQKSTGKTLLSQ